MLANRYVNKQVLLQTLLLHRNVMMNSFMCEFTEKNMQSFGIFLSVSYNNTLYTSMRDCVYLSGGSCSQVFDTYKGHQYDS